MADVIVNVYKSAIWTSNYGHLAFERKVKKI